MAGVEDLLDLNRHISGLLAKAPGWAEQMRPLLTAGFLRRSWEAGAEDQAGEDLIEAIDGAEGVYVEVSADRGWLRGPLGVVVSTCTWAGLGDAYVQVIRVFTHRTDRWQCDYWQETRFDRPRP